ncbi:hypothetical protein JCM18750_21120 [Halostagnicola bangensis]
MCKYNGYSRSHEPTGMPYQFECPRERCSFMLRADGDGEAETLARAHARVAHSSRIAPADLDRWIKPIETA